VSVLDCAYFSGLSVCPGVPMSVLSMVYSSSTVCRSTLRDDAPLLLAKLAYRPLLAKNRSPHNSLIG